MLFPITNFALTILWSVLQLAPASHTHPGITFGVPSSLIHSLYGGTCVTWGAAVSACIDSPLLKPHVAYTHTQHSIQYNVHLMLPVWCCHTHGCAHALQILLLSCGRQQTCMSALFPSLRCNASSTYDVYYLSSVQI